MANNRIAYGLAKKYGIDTKGMTPRQVWDALAEKGITVHGEHEKNAKKSKEELKELVRVSLDYFGKKGHKKPDLSEEIPPVPKEAFGFDNKRLYTKDHIEHCKSMGFKDSKKYNSAAIEFWNNGAGTLYYSERRDNFVKFALDEVTACYCNPEGIIQSYFKYPNIAKAKFSMQLERLIKI